MRTRTALAALAAVAGALTVTGCGHADQVAPVARPTAAPSVIGGALLGTGRDHGDPWILSAERDSDGRLCMSLTVPPEGGILSRTCGLPDAAGDGFRVAAVPGPGYDHYYFSTVPAQTVKVRLDFTGGGSKVVAAKPTPAQLGPVARYFITTAPSAKSGSATVHPLNAAGQPIVAH